MLYISTHENLQFANELARKPLEIAALFIILMLFVLCKRQLLYDVDIIKAIFALPISKNKTENSIDCANGHSINYLFDAFIDFHSSEVAISSASTE